jgi:hypothetical protein
VQRSEGRRTRGMGQLARRLDQDGALRDDVTRAEAAHLLWVLTSFEAFDLLYTGRSLDAEAVADLLVATAVRSLLG